MLHDVQCCAWVVENSVDERFEVRECKCACFGVISETEGKLDDVGQSLKMLVTVGAGIRSRGTYVIYLTTEVKQEGFDELACIYSVHLS